MTLPKPRPSGDGALPPEIAASWRRVAEAGLAPDKKLDRLPVSEVDRTSKLMVAAAPVLDDLVIQLHDTSLCLALANRDCRLIDMRFTDPRVEYALEQIGAVPGSTYSEDISGTNSIATPFETRGPLLVNGEEHFLESLKKFSCFGQPILHPVTRRLEGVLDITGVMPKANPLFVPFIQRAVRDIEHRLLEGSRRSEQFLLAAFQHSGKQRSRAVVVLGEDVVLTNPTAVDMLEAADHATLRTVAPDVPGDRTLVRQLRLASGQVVNLEASRIGGTTGTMFHLAPTSPRGAGVPRRRRSPEESGSRVDRQLAELRGTRSPILVSGEPGSGRTYAVRRLAGKDPLVALDAAEVPSVGEGAWGTRLDDLAATHSGVIAVEEIQLLPAALCVRLGGLLARASARFVLTSTPREQLDPHVAGLATHCVSGVELPPLRHRREELPALVQALVREVRPAAVYLRFTPSTLAALAVHQWPGNLRELAMVVRHATESRSTGDVTTADLPETYRSRAISRSLTPWEQAEHDAIVAALRATMGNKLQAAERLGISRSTLYNRIRALKISI